VKSRPFEIVRDDDGTRHAIGQDFTITVMPDNAETCEIFWRHAVNLAKNPKHELCLVAVLDEARLYVRGNALIMTKKRLMGENRL
jgi:hypothetical protein